MILQVVFLASKNRGMGALPQIKCDRNKVSRMKIPIKTLKIMASDIFLCSGITPAFSTVNFLREAKSAARVASSDKNALMFLGIDRNINLKGMHFAMTKQSSIVQ